MEQYRVHANGEHRDATTTTLDAICAELALKHGKIDRVEPLPAAKPNSTWTNTVSDAEAKARINEQQATIRDAGLRTGGERFAVGTRMADVGYANQRARYEEHLQAALATDACAALSKRVLDEKREDVDVSAGELGRSITTNGRVRTMGLALREQAIRGLFSRLEDESGGKSPALGYVLGLRDRIAAEVGKPEAERDQRALQADKAKLAEVLAHECARYPSAKLRLRARRSLGDCFAIVSPSYGVADAPEVLGELLDALPRDARATWSYDPASTQWEVRAEVWSPTPVDEQAVGEAFQGYASIRSRDNGTSSLEGGGGIILLACLNATTYVSESASARRRHQGHVVRDMEKFIAEATKAVGVLCEAWGVARGQEIEVPEGVKLQDAIPDFWTSMLTQREYAFAGVLRGRSKDHAQKLAERYFDQRRDPNRLVKSDLAQAWTRYVQGFPADTRREAEAAAGAWLVSGGRVPPIARVSS